MPGEGSRPAVPSRDVVTTLVDAAFSGVSLRDDLAPEFSR